VFGRIVGTAAACLLLLGVGVRAATSISSERGRQTLDRLLASPLDTRAILSDKWLERTLNMCWGMVWLGAIYGLAVLTGGVFWLAVLLVMIAWGIQAGLLALVGLRFSMVCRNSLRATVYTLLTMLGIWAGHWSIWMCCLPLLSAANGLAGVGEGLAGIWQFQIFGLTSPCTLGLLAFRTDDFGDIILIGHNFVGDSLRVALMGLIIWTGAAGILWEATSRRFRTMTQRRS
jgi:hypothetical protein